LVPFPGTGSQEFCHPVPVSYCGTCFAFTTHIGGFRMSFSGTKEEACGTFVMSRRNTPRNSPPLADDESTKGATPRGMRVPGK
jgi:hypothetical protein